MIFGGLATGLAIVGAVRQHPSFDKPSNSGDVHSPGDGRTSYAAAPRIDPGYAKAQNGPPAGAGGPL